MTRDIIVCKYKKIIIGR